VTETQLSGTPESRAALLRELDKTLSARKISSDWQTKLARIGSLFSGISAFLYVAISAVGIVSNEPGQQITLIFLLVLGTVFIFVSITAWQLADEVLDCGDSILVRKGRKEQRIPLLAIDDIHIDFPSRPPTIAICLKSPGPFGSTIRFLPMNISMLGYSSPVPSELMSRVLQAKAAKIS
jgi:hypothetical protein